MENVHTLNLQNNKQNSNNFSVSYFQIEPTKTISSAVIFAVAVAVNVDAFFVWIFAYLKWKLVLEEKRVWISVAEIQLTLFNTIEWVKLLKATT